MADTLGDEHFERFVSEAGMATGGQLEAARQAKVEADRSGIKISIADALVKQGTITAAQRQTVEQRLRAQHEGVQQLGKFKLLKKLGEGGMGAVYLAEDTEARGKVAIKVLPQRLAGDSQYLSRFRREARVAFKLNHPNVVSAFEVGEEQGQHFYVMAYCEGESLDHVIKRERVLSPKRAVEIIAQVARGLKHAHEHGVIHRDIKPANLFLTKDGVAKILDLGLSKNVSDSEQSFYTQTGVALGTPHYISPEQAQGERDIDGRSDIYSLGATLYHLITGATPFHGSTAAAIIMKHMNEQLPNPRDLRPEIPEAVVDVIQKMMAKKRSDRYLTCDELLGDLERVLAGQAPSAARLEATLTSIAMARTVVRTPRTQVGQAPVGTAEIPTLPPVSHAARPGGAAVTQTATMAPYGARPAARPAPAVSHRGVVYLGLGAGVLLLAVGTVIFSSVQSNDVPVPNPPAGPATATVTAEAPAAPASKLTERRPSIPAALPELPPRQEPVEQPAAKVPQKAEVAKPKAVDPAAVDQAFVDDTSGRAPEEALQHVIDKLKVINPGYSGQEQHRLGDDRVSELTLSGRSLVHLWPVKGLAGLQKLSVANAGVRDLSPITSLPLQSLDCSYSAVSDLAPLQGARLEKLNITGTTVSDLSPLTGMPLKDLSCGATRVQDLSPLRDLHLTTLNFDLKGEADANIVRGIKTLVNINGMSADEFWRKMQPKSAETAQDPASRPRPEDRMPPEGMPREGSPPEGMPREGMPPEGQPPPFRPPPKKGGGPMPKKK